MSAPASETMPTNALVITDCCESILGRMPTFTGLLRRQNQVNGNLTVKVPKDNVHSWDVSLDIGKPVSALPSKLSFLVREHKSKIIAHVEWTKLRVPVPLNDGSGGQITEVFTSFEDSILLKTFETPFGFTIKEADLLIKYPGDDDRNYELRKATIDLWTNFEAQPHSEDPDPAYGYAQAVTMNVRTNQDEKSKIGFKTQLLQPDYCHWLRFDISAPDSTDSDALLFLNFAKLWKSEWPNAKEDDSDSSQLFVSLGHTTGYYFLKQEEQSATSADVSM